MKILVTGGTGFVGKRLVAKLLSLGYEVRVITRRCILESSYLNNVEYIQADLSTASFDSSIFDGVEILFHCAGEVSNPDRMEILHVNGTARLIDAASGKIRRWVQLSSTGAYGTQRSGDVTEETDPKPVGVYETTKLQSDLLVAAASKEGAFEFTILRPSIVFGSGMPNKSLYALIKKVADHKFFFIGRYGSSANYIHVDNVVGALILCGLKQQAAGNIYNVSDYCKFEEFVFLISQYIGVKPPSLRLPELPVRTLCRLFELYHRWPLKSSRIDALTSFVRFPISKIESLGYRHILSMNDSVYDLVSFYRAINE